VLDLLEVAPVCVGKAGDTEAFFGYFARLFNAGAHRAELVAEPCQSARQSELRSFDKPARDIRRAVSVTGEIAEECRQSPTMERATGIKRLRYLLHAWPRGRLFIFVEVRLEPLEPFPDCLLFRFNRELRRGGDPGVDVGLV
jgi:hypothetical protein